MADIAAIAQFLGRSPDSLIAEAERRDVHILPDTRVSPDYLAETFDFEATEGSIAPGAERSVRFWLLAGLIFVAAAAVGGGIIGYRFLNPLPDWLRPRASTPPLWSILGYLFWGLFTAVWSLVIGRAVLRLPSLRETVRGLVLSAGPHFVQTGDHRACFLRVFALYTVGTKTYVGSYNGFGKTVPLGGYDIPPSVIAHQADFPDDAEVPVYLDPTAPYRFALHRRRGARFLGILFGTLLVLCSLTMFALAGALFQLLV